MEKQTPTNQPDKPGAPVKESDKQKPITEPEKEKPVKDPGKDEPLVQPFLFFKVV